MNTGLPVKWWDVTWHIEYRDGQCTRVDWTARAVLAPGCYYQWNGGPWMPIGRLEYEAMRIVLRAGERVVMVRASASGVCVPGGATGRG